MRQTLWMFTAVTILLVTGCSEFMTSETAAPNTVVDVVGDPSDPVADSTEPSEILGADDSTSIQIIAEADSDPVKGESSEGDADVSNGADQANKLEKQKSNRLNTARRGTSITK